MQNTYVYRHNLKHKTRELLLNVGDVVIIRGDEKNRAHWKTGIVTKLIRGRDGIVRAVQLRAGKSFLERAVQHLYPLELTCDVSRNSISDSTTDIQLNPNVDEFRPKRDAAATARIRIQDQIENENQDLCVE